MEIIFLETARSELDETVNYYNYESSGLGIQFLEEILRCLSLISAYPEAWQKYSERTRRCQTRKFPYGIIYQIRSDKILIIAIANLHRNPDYWKDRL